MTAGIGVAICAIALPKFPGEYWCEKARVAVRNKQYPEAIEFGRKSLAWEKRNPFTHLHIGQAHRLMAARIAPALRKPLYDAAIASFKQGLDLFPQDEELWVRYAQALEGNGRFKEAGEAYRVAINLDPKLGVIRGHYSRFLARVGREAEAEEQAEFAANASRLNLAPIPVHQNLAGPEEEEARNGAPAE
jgi:tetratricopeptide (TPR) repeat protein